jgi:hypothetical protein
MTKITIERETLQAAIDALEPIAYEGDDREARRVRVLRDALRAALAGPPSMQPLPNHDNHHNALKCPYCNPRGLVFAEPEAQPLQNCLDGGELPRHDRSREGHTMTGRELMELAAKAAGIDLMQWFLWDPLTDDGDALRLAVKLRLEIDIHHTGVAVRTPNGIKALVGADDEPDANAATRRAIARAAAEIGKALTATPTAPTKEPT